MYSREEIRNKPKWRRTLVAASLLVTPFAGMLMTSGAASAEVGVLDIFGDCGNDGPGNGNGGPGGGPVSGNSGPENGNDGPENGNDGPPDTPDCDADIDVSCANRSNPSITVVLPDKNGEPFTFEVELRNELDEVVDDEPASSGDAVVLNSGGQGTFTVVIIREQGNQETSYEVNVSCPRRTPRSSTVTTTPPLPSTGSDSSSSLLILAPVMMALGGGLVLARRRMVKA